MSKLDKFWRILYVLIMGAIIAFVFRFVTDSLIEEREKQPVVAEKKLDTRELNCLKQALWYEARGEGIHGIQAVASVIVNRVNSGKYPNSFCKVVYQNKQFSYVHELKEKGYSIKPKPSEYKTYRYIHELSENVLRGQFNSVLDSSVLWYARSDIKNYWTKVKLQVVTIGRHTFYKDA